MCALRCHCGRIAGVHSSFDDSAAAKYRLVTSLL
jgi:hypothetical protein